MNAFQEIRERIAARNHEITAREKAEKLAKKVAKMEKKLRKEQKEVSKAQRKLAKAGNGAVSAGVPTTSSEATLSTTEGVTAKQIAESLAALAETLPGVAELAAVGKSLVAEDPSGKQLTGSLSTLTGVGEVLPPPEVPQIGGMQVIQAKPGSVTVEAVSATPVADVQAEAVKVASIDPTVANTAVGNALLNSRRGNAKSETKK